MGFCDQLEKSEKNVLTAQKWNSGKGFPPVIGNFDDLFFFCLRNPGISLILGMLYNLRNIIRLKGIK